MIVGDVDSFTREKFVLNINIIFRATHISNICSLVRVTHTFPLFIKITYAILWHSLDHVTFSLCELCILYVAMF